MTDTISRWAARSLPERTRVGMVLPSVPLPLPSQVKPLSGLVRAVRGGL